MINVTAVSVILKKPRIPPKNKQVYNRVSVKRYYAVNSELNFYQPNNKNPPFDLSNKNLTISELPEEHLP